MRLHDAHYDAFGLPNEAEDSVSSYPQQLLSKTEIRRIGRELKSNLPDDDALLDRHAEIFRVAYGWRNAHFYPMRSIRLELGRISRNACDNSLTAGRLKRMHSIRLKLRSSKTEFERMQDLGGCRAIVASPDAVAEIVQRYRDGISRHEVRREADYINHPRSSGYRSHHLIMRYKARNERDAQFDGLQIELQARTVNQHAWATAVEAIGLLTGFDLKHENGDQRWVQFFDAMSADIAEQEGCPVVERWSDRSLRRDAIKDLASALSVSRLLEKCAHAVKALEHRVGEKSRYYTMRFDPLSKTVSIRGYVAPAAGAMGAALQEAQFSAMDSVLVDVDRAENLRLAYPNYFLDVGLFNRHITRVIKGYDPGFLYEYSRA